jgi:hypothetical protein
MNWLRRFVIGAAAAGLLACGATQDFGSKPPAANESTADAGQAEPPGSDDAASPRTGHWAWLNPVPQGNDLLGIESAAPDDIWLAGRRGTIVRYDGKQATVMMQGSSTQELYAIWGSGKDDVWFGGQGGGKNLIHWAGTSFSSAYSISSGSIDALWGTAADNVWALSGGGFAHFDGLAWSAYPLCAFCEDAPVPMLRDLWGANAGDVWAVGDDGAIYHYDEDGYGGDGWVQEGSPAAGLADPFAPGNDYIGVWGATSSDVWAVYVNAPANGAHKTGFSHFDGAKWRVAQLEDGGVEQPKNGVRARGHRVRGTSATQIVAMTDSTAWEWNGTSWGKRALRGDLVEGAVWGSPQHGLLAVGADGAFVSLDPAVAPNDPRAWRDVFPAIHDDLSDVTAGADGSLWSLADDRLLRWGNNGWNEAARVTGAHVMGVSAIRALSATDVWAAGVDRDGDGSDFSQNYAFVERFDGKQFGAQQRVPLQIVSGLWVGAANDAWAVGSRPGAAHWNGVEWTLVPTPDTTISSVFGTSAADVWFTGAGTILHWDGTAVREVYRHTAVTGLSVWASGPNDAWVAGQPGFHWDGVRWSPLAGTDYQLRAIWGTGPNDVWQVARQDSGSLVLHWDGTASRNLLEVQSLAAITGTNPLDVWVVGNAGATLRYTADDATGPR